MMATLTAFLASFCSPGGHVWVAACLHFPSQVRVWFVNKTQHQWVISSAMKPLQLHLDKALICSSTSSLLSSKASWNIPEVKPVGIRALSEQTQSPWVCGITTRNHSYTHTSQASSALICGTMVHQTGWLKPPAAHCSCGSC